MTSDREIARWRLRSQHLTTPHAASAAEVVTSLLAVQAENASQAAWAVACRTAQPRTANLDALLDEGLVVRTHVLRPTWHFVARDDISWLLELTAPRIRPMLRKQLQALPEMTLDRATNTVLSALATQPDLTREEISASLKGDGVDLDGFLLMLLLANLELEQLICSGRPRAGTHTYAPYTSRVGATRQLDRTEALAEICLRYFSGHGPATERDLAYWASLTLTDVRRGLDQVGNQLAAFEHDGRTYWHRPGETPPVEASEPQAHLLQILDETYRGYQDSRMLLDSEGIVPGGRETAIGMVLIDAQMVAKMKRSVGKKVVFELSPYDGPLSSDQLEVIEQAASRYGQFLGLESQLLVD